MCSEIPSVILLVRDNYYIAKTLKFRCMSRNKMSVHDVLRIQRPICQFLWEKKWLPAYMSLRNCKKNQKFALHLSATKLIITISRDSIEPTGLQVRLTDTWRGTDSLAFDRVTACSRQFDQNTAGSTQDVFCFMQSPSSSKLITLSKSPTWNLMTKSTI